MCESTHGSWGWGQGQAQGRESQAGSIPGAEPDAGLDLTTLRS